MTDFLTQMATRSLARVWAGRKQEPEAALRRRASATEPPPSLTLHPSGFDLIAEVKRRAPSVGDLVSADVPENIVAARAVDYAEGGAAAISVLTEPTEFAGSLADLRDAASVTPVPVMRKDFLVDPYQVLEARAEGGAGVLIIIRMLDDDRIRELLDAAAEMKLFVLLEAFDSPDLSRAGDLATFSRARGVHTLVGVNARDLGTLDVDNGKFRELRDHVPPHVTSVAESGIESESDARDLAALGYSIALVGSSLMKAGDPARKVAAMIAAARSSRRGACASA